MIQEKFLLKIHKNKLTNPGHKWFSTAFFHKFPTFSPAFWGKGDFPGGDVTRSEGNRKRCYANRIGRVFHREGRMWTKSKYLLKTQSFPHSPQVFPQGFSTAGSGLWNGTGIYIKIADSLRPVSHFFAGRVFHNRIFFVQKNTLDKPFSPLLRHSPGRGKGRKKI